MNGTFKPLMDNIHSVSLFSEVELKSFSFEISTWIGIATFLQHIYIYKQSKLKVNEIN